MCLRSCLQHFVGMYACCVGNESVYLCGRASWSLWYCAQDTLGRLTASLADTEASLQAEQAQAKSLADGQAVADRATAAAKQQLQVRSLICPAHTGGAPRLLSGTSYAFTHLLFSHCSLLGTSHALTLISQSDLRRATTLQGRSKPVMSGGQEGAP